MLRSALLLIIAAPMSFAQEEQTKPPEVPVISDEPKTVDPATLVPEPLATKITVEFRDAALSEVGDWIRSETKIPVLFDRSPIEAIGVSLSEPVSDSLSEEPLYVLLDRLQSLGLAWYYKNEVIRVTSVKAANEEMTTVPYPLGKFLDDGYTKDELIAVITDTLGGVWEEVDGEGGTVEFLGDVLFVRQTSPVHQQLRGLFTALQKHGRRTFILDAPQHEDLRQKLKDNVTVQFDDMPLVDAIESLARDTQTTIRLDRRELRRVRIRDRQPVSLALEDRPLDTVLEVLLAELKLTGMLKDGILWITSQSRAAKEFRTAVYDVRDLCASATESYALQEAITSQTKGPWMELDGVGGAVAFAKSGTMIIRHTDSIHESVLTLLEAYRTALKSSKPREQVNPDEDIIERHYTVQQQSVADLLRYIRAYVASESWVTEDKPEGVGKIKGMIPAGKQPLAISFKKSTPSQPVVVDMMSIVISHKRSVHREISDLVNRVNHGDTRAIDPSTGGGLGGGGFGGGFFSIDSERRNPSVPKN